MSAQVTKCLMFLVSLAHRAVQGAPTEVVNLSENGEMAAKVKGLDHPNFVCGLQMVLRYWKTTGLGKSCRTGRVVTLHHSSVRWPAFSTSVSSSAFDFTYTIPLSYILKLLTVETFEWW